MKLIDVLGFTDFYVAVKDQKMPFKTAYKFYGLAHKIEEQTQFYRDKLNEIINEYSVKDENGNITYSDDGDGIKIIPGKEAECSEKIIELQNLDIDIKPTIEPEELEQFELMPIQIQGIAPFIKG